MITISRTYLCTIENANHASFQVCLDLHDPSVRMNEAEMSMFSPFRPMLGQRGSIEEVSTVTTTLTTTFTCTSDKNSNGKIYNYR